MLSYQHHYHAGNPADVHKHALLAWMLGYLTAKDKPLSYIETHAGRGLYDLDDPAARKTGEAAAGIGRLEALLPRDQPYLRVLDAIRAAHGPSAYPGSPLIAARLLRPQDRLSLAELHPGEHARLRENLAAPSATIRRQDGFDMALSLCPPSPRRGMVFLDPSYEVKAEYDTIPATLGQLARKWNVGVLVLWYPILADNRHRPMLDRLVHLFPAALRDEVGFAPVRPGHRMTGSGLFVVNPPYGLAAEAARIAATVFGAQG